MEQVTFSEALMARVTQLRVSFINYSKDGFQFNEICKFFFEAIDSLSSLGSQYMEMDSEQQKAQVIAALRGVYMSKNVDIPWIGEPFETMVEQAMFTYVLPQLFDVLLTRKVRSRVAQMEQAQAIMPASEPM